MSFFEEYKLKLSKIIYKLKYTMRFSILSIFIALFVTSILLIASLSYLRLSRTISHVAFQFMEQTSFAIFEEITSEINDIALEGISFADMIQLGILDPNHLEPILDYTYNLMAVMARTLPSLESAYWGDETGSFVLSRKLKHNNIKSIMIDRRVSPYNQRLFYRDSQGKMIQNNQLEIINTEYKNFDPRNRVWYTTAKQEKKLVWLDVHKYTLTPYLGITVSTPVFKKTGDLIGVFALNLRLDYFRHFVETLKISPNGIVYIVTNHGKVVAFPNLPQYQKNMLLNIHDLSYPWVIKSFDYYQKTKATNFILRSGGKTYMSVYLPLPFLKEYGWLIGVIAPESDFIGPLIKTNLIGLFICGTILIIGIIIMSQLVNKIVKPLNKVVDETEKIKRFQLEDTGRIDSRIREISKLSDAIYNMKQGLRSFRKYVPANLVRQLIETGKDVIIGGEKKQLAIFFSDIKDFTAISEQIDPNRLMEHICEYFNEISHIILETRGTIDKYIGDAVMAFWGAPLPEEKPAHLAAEAALRCAQRLKIKNSEWIAENKPELNTRIALHFGEAIVGNLGSDERLNYTAVGDVINTTSRLEKISKIYGINIIASDAFYQAIKEQFVLRMVDCIMIRGRKHSTYVYELLGKDINQLHFNFKEYQPMFTQGFTAYQKGEWDTAIQYFYQCLHVYPTDTVSPIFIKRCEKFKITPPDPDWNGIWEAQDK